MRRVREYTVYVAELSHDTVWTHGELQGLALGRHYTKAYWIAVIVFGIET